MYSYNVNYMMALELIAQCDPFLALTLLGMETMAVTTASYLSSRTREQFIALMSEKLLDIIVQELKCAKYFFIIVDSTPDVVHIDQLSLVLRYVKMMIPQLNVL